MNPTTADHHADTQPATELRWRRALGLQLLGPVQGSGLRDVAYLVRRSDDQMVQLSELLHLVVVHVEPPRPAAEVAAAVSASYGRTLTVEGLEHLVTTRLQPLGLVLPEESEELARPVRARPILALTVKATLLPTRWTRRVAAVLSPLLWPPLVVAALVGLVVADVALLSSGGFWPALTELFITPTLALVIYALLTLAAVFHEFGHAAACRYGGAEPGRSRRRHLHRLPGLLHRCHRLLPAEPRQGGCAPISVASTSTCSPCWSWRPPTSPPAAGCCC